MLAPESALPPRCYHWPSMLARLAAAVSILTAMGAAQVPAPPHEDPGLTIRVESNLVLVPLHVSKKGTAVTGLGPEEFEVFEDGVLQEVAFVEGPAAQGESTLHRRRVPKEIIFLIDVSLSVSRWRLLDDETLRKGILDALTEDFLISIYGFGSRLRHYAGPTRDPDELVRALHQLAVAREGRSLVYNSIFSTLSHAEQRGGNARRRLLVFSDGMDTTRFNPSRVVEAANALGISISPVLVAPRESLATSGPPARTGPKAIDLNISKRRAALRSSDYRAHTGKFHGLGQKTGGSKYVIDVMDWMSLSRITESVSKLAQTEYLVGYYPRNVDEGITMHEAKIRLKDKRIGKLRGGRRLVAH